METASTISIKEFCGKNIVTRNDGKKVRDKIESEWRRFDRIKIDFGNVLVASVSFMDEIFGQLALKFPRIELTDKLVIENIQDFDRALLNDIMKSRFQQRELTPQDQA